MKRKVYSVVLLFAVMVLAGCETTGMSMRERGSFNYSNFVYGLYDKDESAKSEKKEIVKPMKIAVAQVGENAPPQSLIDQLRNKPELFSKVVPLPVGGPDIPNYYGSNQSASNPAEFQDKMIKMRRLASDLGVDYIFLFGGSADYGSTPSIFEILDFTIVGAYIFPTNKITAEGRAAGALIDVSTGQVVCMVNSESKKEKNTPTFLLYAEQEQVVVQLRDDLVSSLSKEFIDKAYSL